MAVIFSPPVPEIRVEIDMTGVPSSDRSRLGQLLFRELARVGRVGDGGGGERKLDAWVIVDDANVALLQLQAIVAGQGLADRARIRVRPKTALIKVEYDSSSENEAIARAMMTDLAAFIHEREIGENLVTLDLPGSIEVSLHLHNPDIGIPVIEALIDELGIGEWVELEVCD